MNYVKLDSNVHEVLRYNTRSRTQQNIVSCIQYILKAQPEDGYIETTETCSCEILREIYFDNICLIESCVRLYSLYIHICVCVLL